MPTSEPDKLFQLSPAQSSVFNCAARFRVLVAGRRFGKTHLALTEMIEVALQSNKTVWYVGPTDSQSKRIVWDRLKALTRPYWAQIPSETETRIRLGNGSDLRVNSGFKPDKLRGDGIDFVVLDEFASMKPEVWSEVLRPALADRKGRALFIGTPLGRNHLYDFAEYAKTDPDWASFHFTSEQGCFIDHDELQSAARQMDPASFGQEYGAEFAAIARHRVYYAFDRALHLSNIEFEPNYPLMWSIDFNINPMSMLLIQRINDVLHVIDEIVLPNANTESACQAFFERTQPFIKKISWHHMPFDVHIYADASGNQHRTSAAGTDWDLIRQFMSHQKGVYKPTPHIAQSNPLVRDRVTCVNSRLRNTAGDIRLLINPRCVELIKDLEQVSWAVDATGAATTEINKSDRLRTHTSDALGYYVIQAFPPGRPIGPQSSGRLF